MKQLGKWEIIDGEDQREGGMVKSGEPVHYRLEHDKSLTKFAGTFSLIPQFRGFGKSHLERSEQKSSENRPPNSGHSEVIETPGAFFGPPETYIKPIRH